MTARELLFYINLIAAMVSIAAAVSTLWIRWMAHRELAYIKDLREGYERARSESLKFGGRPIVKTVRQEFWFEPSPDGSELCLLGHDIRIRRTAVGKRFRLVHNGREVGAYDDEKGAILGGFDLAVKELVAPEDLSKAPKIEIPGMGDEPG